MADRPSAVAQLVSQLDQNDNDYLAEQITREEWLQRAKAVDERLNVVGLRLTVRPWLPAAQARQ
jgi:hypothetical protein